MYLIRLDDACEYMDVEKWTKMETLLDKYGIKPLVGIIPACEDPKMKGIYQQDLDFWNKVKRWKNKGWTMALHGYQHLYVTKCGGINPVNNKSEFAGLPLEEQKEKIRKGNEILINQGIHVKVFFAPSHTFDANTLLALKEESEIRIISDTISSNIYYENDFWFVPSQSGSCRNLPFKTATFCFHPNTMKDDDFDRLEKFISKNTDKFTDFNMLDFEIKKKKTLFDNLLNVLYFAYRKIRTAR